MFSLILVVDCDEGPRQATAALLRDFGYTVSAVGNGVDGYRAALKLRPNLILVDLWPFSSASIQMVESLRGDQRTADIPILIVTSVVGAEYRARAGSVGCEGYLEKPCCPEDLLAEIRRILITRRLYVLLDDETPVARA